MSGDGFRQVVAARKPDQARKLGLFGVALGLLAFGCELVYTTRERPADDASIVSTDDGGGALDSGAPVDGGGNSTYRATVLADAPVAYFRFGEASGEIARDEMGRSFGRYGAGSGLGIPGAISGDVDTAVDLDGSGRILMAPGLDFAGTAPFTVEAWARAEASPAPYAFLLDHERYDVRGGWALVVGDQGVFFERWANGNVGASASGPPLPRGQWHHLAGVFDGSTQRLFIDGVQVNEIAAPASIPSVDGGWSMGRQNCGECATFRYIGGVDELAIYDRALAAARIVAHVEAAGRR